MSKVGRMAEADVRPVIFQVLEGLHHMHREGFAHRDIKPGVGGASLKRYLCRLTNRRPQNVLIKSQPPQSGWWVKLSDFGISKRIEGAMEMLSTVKGTPPYMAPELLTHEPGSKVEVDHRAADMWSLGEMAYRMLTRTATFSSMPALFRYVMWPDLFPSQELAKHGVSGGAETFIRVLMKPTPENRLTSGKAMEHAWIQPCTNFGEMSAVARTSSLEYAIFLFFFSLSSPLSLPTIACSPSG